MPIFEAGLIHTPVTPFTVDNLVDFERYEKLIDFHLRNGADALALPMHAGESVNLMDTERRALLEFAIKQVKGRAPVIAHVSYAGTAIAAALARHAEESGAAAIIATAPYYWTPPAAMLLEHLVEIGSAVQIPFFVYNAPEEMGGQKVTTGLALKLIERVENFAGVVDSSLDWEFMIDVLTFARPVRPSFQLVSGTEYMISAGAIGCAGMFAPLAGVAPKLVRGLYDLCVQEKYKDARKSQEAIAALRQAVNKDGVASLKAAMRAMGRDCAGPRLPLLPVGEAHYEKLARELGDMAALSAEHRGW